MLLPGWLRQHLAALRALLVLTALTGVAYPLLVTAIVQLPGLRGHANGSLLTGGATASGRTVGSRIIGQSFADADGNPLRQYFQSRPSAAGEGYDPTATSASNLGPEYVLDTLPDPSKKGDEGTQSLLTQVCARSKAAGERDGVDGSRPFCTPGGLGAVLAVFGPRDTRGHVAHPRRVVSVNEACPAKPFLPGYEGVTVECAHFGENYSAGATVPVRGEAPARPAVPSDAVTASASGLDPDISVAYARLQAPRVAHARGVDVRRVHDLVGRHTKGRTLGFMGEPTVNVLELNLDLDRSLPYPGT